MVPMSETLAPSVQPVTARDSKGTKFMEIVEAAYNKARLNEEEAQRINDTPGLAKLIGDFIINNRSGNKYASEEKLSSYGYLSGYTKPTAITDQIDILRMHWPALKPDAAIRYAKEVYPALQHPDWVEGPFALIRPGFFSDKYGEELKEILEAIKKDRQGRFYNYREGQLDEQHLRQAERTADAMRKLVERQSGSDILIVGEQFGIRHRGRSVRRAREVFVPGEFGEGARNIGTMILTNPIRLNHDDDLWVDAPGDEFFPGGVDRFVRAPYFHFFDGKVRFSTDYVDNPYAIYGSASGLLPQE